jgi:integrase
MGELRQRGTGKIWWVRYYRNGKRHEESSGSTKESTAKRLLRIREGDIAKGVPVTAQIGRLRYEEAAEDLLNEYRTNARKSLDETQRRTEKHLTPFFGGRRMAAITTADVRRYIAQRLAATTIVRRAHDVKRPDGTVRHIPEQQRTIASVSNAEINRELTLLKRMFTLAMEAEKLLHRPKIPMLKERNTRTGFFEPAQFAAVRSHLPAPLAAMAEFSYITGWRVPSEVLVLEWRQVDFGAGEIRLDPHQTKNGEGRVFPMTDDLRALLDARRRVTKELERTRGQIIPWVFFRLVAKGRRGPKSPKPIRAFTKVWKAACRAAGCPGRIPHDFRRTAIRNMVRRGVPERVAMQMSGHITRSVFERYNIVSEADLRTAAVQLQGLTGIALQKEALK